jgi:partner of Y14 and mago
MATSKSGIQHTQDGSYIPASTRADGTTRKEIRVRPGYRPPEDVETYKNRSAESWKNRGSGGVPGADPSPRTSEQDSKSKNAKRREAARKKAAETTEGELSSALEQSRLDEEDKLKQNWRKPENLATNDDRIAEAEQERQKKVRNALKKLKGVRELKEKKVNGEKLSPDQLVKIGKERELLRDLEKLNYDGPEMNESNGNGATIDPPP